ncbi:cytosine-purine permease [Coprinopsis cinerea okayama7|uniref:Cytosine-purine permease n=1 Tax=Coprinopsis cinerea (strain Okayama-7 / 130 / ATCC MYA-4618 / FGSC 9003) TaxID=240176 RepID=D6RPT7_COPC7|nr:cytosine-purine permease [Coprinopsis cinerea okayama7\|eukprot:XP_002910569.1 cytosine-purine permease [Coprinopsis cinerea okayama7\
MTSAARELIVHDHEKGLDDEKASVRPSITSVGETTAASNPWTTRLLKAGVEERGTEPVPEARRTDTQFFKLFFLFLTWNLNILTFTAGTIGPVVFGLGLGDSCLVIIFFDALFCSLASYICTWGPKLGMRTMILARYSFGYYGTIPLALLNLLTMMGFSVLCAIVGGQALASVTEGLTWTVGIVVIASIALLVSFCGVNALNWLGLVGWVPLLTAFAVVAGVGGKHFSDPPPVEPVTAPALLSFAATLAGFSITFCPLATDISVYYRHDVSGWRVFMYVYAGLLTSLASIQILGAATAVAAMNVPEWERRYGGEDVGALLAAVLEPVNGFGKFISVLLALSVTPNISATAYSITVIWQACVPRFSAIPRYVFAIVSTGIVIGLAIPGATRFYDTLTNLLGLVGYWAAAFIAIVLIEHLHFRKNDPYNYDGAAWNVPNKLPLGIAAVAAVVCSFGLVVPCMNQTWYTGPIAKMTGDIGFEIAIVLTGMLYFPFRSVEKRFTGL